jgi:PAS domain S-box-containing protein
MTWNRPQQPPLRDVDTADVISVPIVAQRTAPEDADGFERVGSFRYLKTVDRWEWSAAVARMHGYGPGTVVPTTELLLSHEHPDDKSAVSEVIDQVLRHGAAFSSRHRIVDTVGGVHTVVVVGDPLVDDAGAVIGTMGFYIDVTDSFEADMQRSVSDAVAEIDERRAVIHEAVGIIRMAYGVSSQRAFDVLRWRSQESNVKLRAIAERLVGELAENRFDSGLRAHIDHLLLTVHDRIAQ